MEHTYLRISEIPAAVRRTLPWFCGDVRPRIELADAPRGINGFRFVLQFEDDTSIDDDTSIKFGVNDLKLLAELFKTSIDCIVVRYAPSSEDGAYGDEGEPAYRPSVLEFWLDGLGVVIHNDARNDIYTWQPVAPEKKHAEE